MAKRIKKSKVVDVKKAAAHDVEVPEVKAPEVKLPAKNASAVQKGATYAVLAGRPSKQAVTACFTKSGYALSWVARAARLNMTPEQLCADFKSDPAAVKAAWEKLTTKS